MKIYTDLKTKSIDELKQTVFPFYTEKPFVDAPPLRQLSTPYRLQVLTYNNDTDESQFILANISPEKSFYSILSEDKETTFFDGLYAHQHDFYEFVIVLEGKFYQNIENEAKLFERDEICIFNKNVRHSINPHPESNFQIALLQISDEFMNTLFADISQKLFTVEREHHISALEHFFHNNLSVKPTDAKTYLHLTPFGNHDNISSSVYHMLDDITKESVSPKFGSTYFIKDQITRLLFTFSNSSYYDTRVVHINTSRENLIFNQISAILEKSYGRTTRSELEELLHYSGVYLNEISKKYTGMTLFNYGMTFCMKQAAYLLLNSDLSVSTIAEQLGFSNRTHFYHMFSKAYAMTPHEFREKYNRSQ